MTPRLTFFIVAALVAQAGFAQLFGDQQIISSTSDGANCVHSSDMDGDGDMDVLATSNQDDRVTWFENLGGGLFSAGVNLSTQVDMPKSVYAADLDGDGDMDALSASRMDSKVYWYENLGGGLFSAAQVVANVVSLGAWCVRTADIDGDGDMDVVSAAADQDRIYWHENLGSETFMWHILAFESQIDDPKSVQTADLDGDGLPDVLSASFADDKIAWYKNLGGGTFSTQLLITTQADGAYSTYTTDLDGDSDLDVLSASIYDDKIAWYENLGSGVFGAQQIISTLANAANCVYAADLDNDGDKDVISSSSDGVDHRIAWYENLGGGNFGYQQVITTLVHIANYVYAADLDGDGDLEVLSASGGDDKIAWYENLLGEGCMDAIACNYDVDAWIDNGSCCYANCGCTDPVATNYLPTATCENGSCTYVEGCTNESAYNFNPLAIIDNGTCTFNITGTVFFDENENGVMDVNEYGLPFQTVVNEESGQTYMTNDDGDFIANSGQAAAVFEQINTDLFPFNTTVNPQLFDPGTAASTQLLFGVSNQSLDFEVDINFYPGGNTFLCNDFFNHNIFFRNMGNVPIDGIIEIEYDELFQGYQEVTPIDSVIGNTVYMSYENLLPGQMFFYDIDLLTPTVDHIGEFVTSYARVYGYYEGNQVAYGEKERTTEITCAYDPNDKQAFPLGYTDQHLLLQETRQEFVIRFQNTGNAPAQNIRVQDTLDVNFDIESFRIIANSHSVMTTIDPETRLVDFYFENIQLPDSVNNEPASHGVISYMITPLPNLPVGTVLENTAYIYFDNNDPIITNTTWTTIHECGGESAFEPVAALVCNEPQVNFENTYQFVDQYSWQLDGVSAGANSELLLSSIDQSGYEVTLTASNPLCTETTTLNYVVPPIEAIDPCRADFNCDGNRDTQDLLVFMSEFGCLNACEADIDENAIVNVQDLFIFISVFDQSCWE